MAEYKLSATLELKDRFTAAVDKARKSASSFTSVLGTVGGAVDGAASSMARAGSAAQQMAGKTDQAKRSLQGIKGDYTATIRARDMATSAVRKVSQDISSLTKKTHTIAINVKQNLAPLNDLKNKLSDRAKGLMSGIPTQMLGFMGIGAGITSTLKTYTDFTHQMSRVQAISGASAEEFAQLNEKAKERGMNTQFTAAEAGKAMEYMAMAGWKTNDMLNGITGIMDLAAASGEDLGRVSDIVTDALTAFKLQAKDAGHFADVLAAAASNSNTNVGMMGYTFQYVAPLAGTLGFNIEDTALAIGLMANQGIKAEKAGTALRSLFSRLATQPKQAAAAMSTLGFSMKDGEGKMKSLRAIMQELRKDFKGRDKLEQASLAKGLAGEEAVGGFLAIMNASDADWNKLQNALDKAAGTAKKQADVSTSNLWGSIKALQSGWESVQLAFMSQGPGSGVKEFVDAVTSDLRRFSESMKDGLDIRDITDLAKTAIQQLYDKFIKLDGVGSILAGGTLAYGLKKVIGWVKAAGSGLDTIVKGKTGTGIPGSSGTGLTDMVVNANNVVVNGKGVAGGTDTVATTAGGTAGKNYLGSIIKWAPTGIAAIKGLYSIYKAEGEDAKMRAGMGAAVQTGAAALGTAVGGPMGGIVAATAAQGAVDAFNDPVWAHERSSANSEMYLHPIENLHEDAEGNLDMTDRFNADLETMKGNFLDWLQERSDANAEEYLSPMGDPDRFNADWEAMKQSCSETWDSIKESANSAMDSVQGALDGLESYAGGIWESIKSTASEAWSSIGSLASNALAGAKSVGNGIVDAISKAPDHEAVGSSYYAGGWTEINEHGGELIDLPEGSRIYPHATTEHMLEKQFASMGSSSPQVTVSGNTFVVRNDADITKIAYELANLIQQGSLNYGGGYA